MCLPCRMLSVSAAAGGGTMQWTERLRSIGAHLSRPIRPVDGSELDRPELVRDRSELDRPAARELPWCQPPGRDAPGTQGGGGGGLCRRGRCGCGGGCGVGDEMKVEDEEGEKEDNDYVLWKNVYWRLQLGRKRNIHSMIHRIKGTEARRQRITTQLSSLHERKIRMIYVKFTSRARYSSWV